MAMVLTGALPARVVVSTGLALTVGEGAVVLSVSFSCAVSANEPVNEADNLTCASGYVRVGGTAVTIQCSTSTSPGWSTRSMSALVQQL
ncbi:MAG: hypothetical protein B7X41_08795 [Microbacterium sp. 14-71-5]|nr:MAG: hypothetical protein B7X41_08795 [Microbacterium sp. 14-71-5]